VETACSVSAGGIWKTPNPTAGIECPSFNVTACFSRELLMTQSLPGAPELQFGAKRGPTRWTSRKQEMATTVGVKVIPWIPTPAKRLLTGGRSVIIDGNTLDPTLQLMLSGLKLAGIDGLVIDDDRFVSRAVMHETNVGMPGPQIHVEVNELTLPG